MIQLTPQVVLATSGMQADADALRKTLDYRIKMYQHNHNCYPSVFALNRLLSNTLYYKRFFPYYTFNLLAGVDPATGEGVVFNYDAIGSDERVDGSVAGTGGVLMRAFMDNQVDFKNQTGVPKRPLAAEEAISLVKDAFASATERDMFTGDSVDILLIRSAGISQENMPLRRD